MALTVADLQAGELEARAILEEWAADWEKQFQAPMIQAQRMQTFIANPGAAGGDQAMRTKARQLAGKLSGRGKGNGIAPFSGQR